MPPAAAAQTAEPPELVQLRQQYATRALAASKLLSEQYTLALAGVAKEAGAEGDYEQALAAQKTRQELADLYANVLADPSLSNVMVLKPADARLSGAVMYDKTLGVLANWRTVGSVASWDIQRITPGRYDVIVTYGVAPLGEMPTRINIYAPLEDLATGGEFEFYEDSSLAGAAMNRRSGAVADTGGWDKPATLRLAPITLTRSSSRFALKITRTRGNGGVMRLMEIRLVPASDLTPAPLADAAAPGPGPDGAPLPPGPPQNDLGKLREGHLARVRKVIQPLVDAYAANLTTLAEKAKAAKEEEWAEELIAESTNVQRLVRNPARIAVSSSQVMPATTLAGQGFKVWESVRYVPNPNNTGDQFQVQHDGAYHTVRLLWVTCPPPVDASPAETKAFADYFKLAPNDVTVLGKQAQIFTDTYLRDKPLRIFTRGTKGADDVILVAVQPEGVGDFAGVLVDNGLARINLPGNRGRNTRRYEEITLQALKARETVAKGRPIPPGAWGLRPEMGASSLSTSN
jgi:hypothetical protein